MPTSPLPELVAGSPGPPAHHTSRLAQLLRRVGEDVVVQPHLTLVPRGSVAPRRAAHERTRPPHVADLYERHVFGALNSVAPAERECIELTYFDGLAVDEIAGRCGVSILAVEDRLRRGLDDMLRYLRARA